MKKNKILITGTSRGIGESLAIKFLNENWDVHGFSRHKNDQIKKNIKRKSLYKETIGDISNIKDARRFLKKSLIDVTEDQCEQIILINNAGILEPVKKIRECELEEMIYNFKVNVLGTCSLISLFLSELKDIAVPKYIINISSGAGKNPYHSWGSYCASKAAIDMFSQCVDLEEKNSKNAAKIFSIAPGVVETKMQETIRTKSLEDFPLVNKFIELKESNKLLETTVVADKFFKFIGEIKNHQDKCILNITDF